MADKIAACSDCDTSHRILWEKNSASNTRRDSSKITCFAPERLLSSYCVVTHNVDLRVEINTQLFNIFIRKDTIGRCFVFLSKSFRFFRLFVRAIDNQPTVIHKRVLKADQFALCDIFGKHDIFDFIDPHLSLFLV
jgi:hypothetical protein